MEAMARLALSDLGFGIGRRFLRRGEERLAAGGCLLRTPPTAAQGRAGSLAAPHSSLSSEDSKMLATVSKRIRSTDSPVVVAMKKLIAEVSHRTLAARPEPARKQLLS